MEVVDTIQPPYSSLPGIDYPVDAGPAFARGDSIRDTQKGETQQPMRSSVAPTATLHREANPTLSTEPEQVMVPYGKETQQYQVLFSNLLTLVDALSSLVTAETLADKLYFRAGLITTAIWEETYAGGVFVTNSKKHRQLLKSILSQVELDATNYGKFLDVLKEFDELKDILPILEMV